MNINVKLSERTRTLFIEGDVNTLTAPELDNAIEENAPQSERMILDFKDVKYISSAGIRAVLRARQLKGSDRLTLKNLSKNVSDIFKITGFTKILNIE